MNIFIVFLVLSGVNFIRAEDCESYETCGRCIGNVLGNLHCVWCPDNNHPGQRCISIAEFEQKTNKTPWCTNPYYPRTETPKVLNSTGIFVSQLQPEHIFIKARVGDTVDFKITYKPAKDYPIDIYYLFDNSYTMRKYKSNLVSQAHQIYEALRKLSNNVRFGAGSFVEKLALPFSKVDDQLNTFNNHLSLTDNIYQFVDTIKEVKSASNLDDPEAGLDALMQAMICDEINWRKSARRIIILATDEMYHSAGDGRAVGAYKPHDMKCHLKHINKPGLNHTYDKEASLTYDYPSVSQINAIAKKTGISIFFTVRENVLKGYQALAKAIHGATCIKLQVDDSSDSYLVNMIIQEYVGLTRTLEIQAPEVPPHLELLLDPDCKKNDQRCKMSHGGTVNINARLSAKHCPSNNKYNNTLTVASLNDKLTIDVETICQCECEKKNGEANSSICSVNGASHGTLQCGICRCDLGWYGKTCQCPGLSTEKDDLLKCKISANDKPCSGRGECRCGVCICWEGYDGEQCQYRTNDCLTHDDKVCAGNGKCEKSKCTCNSGWEGPDCTCSTSIDPCIGANGKVCSGNGNCKCSTCNCTSKKYNGKYCDLCGTTCIEERCEQLKKYVICNYDGENPGDKKTCDNIHKIKTDITVQIKNQTEIEGWSEGYYCKKSLADQSSIVYKYLDGNNSTLLWVQKEKELPPEANIWIPIGSVIGAILLIGILTLIAWKVLVDIHDAREYRRFAKQAEESGFDVVENPLYKPAAVNINNPAYKNTAFEK